MPTTLAVRDGALWSARKIAEELGISVRSVWRYQRDGRLPAPCVVEGSEWMLVWRASEVIGWMEENGLCR